MAALWILAPIKGRRLPVNSGPPTFTRVFAVGIVPFCRILKPHARRSSVRLVLPIFIHGDVAHVTHAPSRAEVLRGIVLVDVKAIARFRNARCRRRRSWLLSLGLCWPATGTGNQVAT